MTDIVVGYEALSSLLDVDASNLRGAFRAGLLPVASHKTAGVRVFDGSEVALLRVALGLAREP